MCRRLRSRHSELSICEGIFAFYAIRNIASDTVLSTFHENSIKVDETTSPMPLGNSNMLNWKPNEDIALVPIILYGKVPKIA